MVGYKVAVVGFWRGEVQSQGCRGYEYLVARWGGLGFYQTSEKEEQDAKNFQIRVFGSKRGGRVRV